MGANPVNVDDRAMMAALAEIEQRAGSIAAVLPAIGNVLVDDARLCFRESRDPWGASWAPLRESTLHQRAARGTGGKPFKKAGGLKKRAAAIIASAKPLLDTGVLRNSITFRVEGNTLVVGTNLVKAGTLQFGADQGAYGATKHGAGIPWGSVPARPYLPVRTRGGEVELPPAVREQAVELLARYLFGR